MRLREVHKAYVGDQQISLDRGSPRSRRCSDAPRVIGSLRLMAFIFVISREPRMRTTVTEYLRGRGFDTAAAATYDLAIDTLVHSCLLYTSPSPRD